MDFYRASTFNTCENQPLPLIQGPLLEFKVDQNVVPHAVYTPATVPAHWTKKVKADIDRNVALGVLEPVPLNTPTNWLHTMVITRNHKKVLKYCLPSF